MQGKKRAVWTALFAALLCAPALAEAGAETTQAGYDWADLGTVAGAAAAVLLIVQYTKKALDKFKKFPTRLYVYILSLAILACARLLGGGLNWRDVPLLALNAVVAATSAMGAYEMAYRKGDENAGEETDENAGEETKQE